MIPRTQTLLHRVALFARVLLPFKTKRDTAKRINIVGHKQRFSVATIVGVALSPRQVLHIEMPEGTKMTVQERAYTSPIWYTP